MRPAERRKPVEDYVCSNQDVSFVVDQIKTRNVDIAPDYYDYVNLGFAFAENFPEAEGLDYFKTIARAHGTKDKDSEYQFKNCLKHRGGGVTMSTFFWLAKKAGLEVSTPRTQTIVAITKNRLKSVGKKWRV